MTSVAKISKLMLQLHCNKWSETAESLTFFNRFPVKLETPINSAALVKENSKFYYKK